MSGTDMEFFIVFQKKPSIGYNVRNLRTAEKVKEKKNVENRKTHGH